MTGFDNLVSAYVRLLVWQFQLPKAQKMCAIVVKQILADGVAVDVRDAFNIDTAVGKQLDILAKYVGVPRSIGLPAALPYFGFWRYSGLNVNDNGFRSYNTAQNSSGLFYRMGYSGTRNTDLSDTSFAFMIALKIILNASDGTLASIQTFLAALVPGAVTVRDNKDMTLTYTITGQIPVDPTVLGKYLPKPMGVGITVQTNDFLVTDSGDFLVTDSGDKLVTSVP